MTSASLTPITEDAARFDAALSRLETALAASVHKVADMARRTGFEDGVAFANAELANADLARADLARADLTSADLNKVPDLTPILREELEAARTRETNLQEAVTAARAALDEAMDDIRAALGPL